MHRSLITVRILSSNAQDYDHFSLTEVLIGKRRYMEFEQNGKNTYSCKLCRGRWLSFQLEAGPKKEMGMYDPPGHFVDAVQSDKINGS